MKLVILDQQGRPMAQVEDAPQDCAVLLHHLEQQRNNVKPGKVAESSPRPVRKRAVAARRSSVSTQRSNRRQKVLDAFKQLSEQGVHEPQLDQIITAYASANPEDSIVNLDQVIRDLANKTDLLERCSRRTFRLARAE